MKKSIIILITSLLSLYFSACSKSSNPVSDNSNQNSAATYFPGEVGSNFNYEIQVDSSGGNSRFGERLVTFTGTTTKENINYYIQSNNTTLSGVETSTISYFRRTIGGIYYFVDTTGLYRFIGNFVAYPDKELGILTNNLSNNATWTVYKMNVSVFSIINLTATYQGSEDLVLNLKSGQVSKTADKIKYSLTLTIPALTDSAKAVNSKFDASFWFVKDIGLVKNQGNLTVVNAICGYDIDFSDTTKTIVQNLTSYEIK
jgi:hypothetical protein